jgi:hypothetical protein
MDKDITCPRCHRSQPESLGVCDFCAEMDMDRAIELADERHKEVEE